MISRVNIVIIYITDMLLNVIKANICSRNISSDIECSRKRSSVGSGLLIIGSEPWLSSGLKKFIEREW